MLRSFTLTEVAEALTGNLLGADALFAGVGTDSRKAVAGQLFVALTGPRFDGHAYLADVAAQGAAAALVERAVPEVQLPQLVVADTRLALGRLGAFNRDLFQGRLAAVTGSSGKTTVKELLAAILRQQGATLATQGNLNNELGAPLTLLQLAAEHAFGVIELGASHVGDIAYTVSLTRPDVVIITNAGQAHVGEFGGVDRIVEAKGEIIEGVGEGGTVVLNRDDAAFDTWQRRAAGRRVVAFGLDARADVRATDVSLDSQGRPSFLLHVPQGEARITLQLLGAHNVGNALAAAAAALSLGLDLPTVARGLAAAAPVQGRTLTRTSQRGAQVIDDSYNANPASVKAGIDLLAALPGRRVVVLGDIAELGEWTEQGHREVGEHARGKVDAFYAVGPSMAHAARAYGAAARHFADREQLIEALADEDRAGTTLLIKGSRSAAMDKVVAALCAINTEEKH
ncbi:MAG: UDP-N-acetylmuramoyl-tripeptide--D-alanyl-D-alanine ligase [Pseudomonas oryzihabitans]